jgi:hypothetical protein
MEHTHVIAFAISGRKRRFYHFSTASKTAEWHTKPPTERVHGDFLVQSGQDVKLNTHFTCLG